jgi:hypothetical protein
MTATNNSSTPLEPFPVKMDRIIAESEIRALAARFSDAVTRNDPAAFSSLWRADSVWEINEPLANKATGQIEIVELFRRLRPAWSFFSQLTHSGVIEFQSESIATARWAMREVARSNDGTQSYDNLGLYEDRLEWRAGEWMFKSRTYHYLWISDVPLVGRSFALPARLSPGG